MRSDLDLFFAVGFGLAGLFTLALGTVLIRRPDLLRRLLRPEDWANQPFWGRQRYELSAQRWYLTLFGLLFVAAGGAMITVDAIYVLRP